MLDNVPAILCLFLLLCRNSLEATAGNYCPASCHCVKGKTSVGGLEVSCNAKGLRSIPPLPWDTVSVDLSGNSLSRISFNSFPELPGLKALWLDNNRIGHIEAHSFRGMQDCDVISIRRNAQLEHLTKHAFSGLRRVRSLLLTDNNISWIEKNAFYGSSHIDLLVLYGNPLTELRPNIFNNLQHVGSLRLPIGINSIIPGAFYGLSHIPELTLEGLDLATLKTETFFNLTHVGHLRIHDSVLRAISPRAFAGMKAISALSFSHSDIPSLDADMFDGLSDMFTRLTFEKNRLGKVQLDFPGALRHVAHKVVFDANEADCCLLSGHNLRVWRSLASQSALHREFLHGVWCVSPKWVLDENLLKVDMVMLRNACAGTLDQELQHHLTQRMREKPSLSELYRIRNSAAKIDTLPLILLLTLLLLILVLSVNKSSTYSTVKI